MVCGGGTKGKGNIEGGNRPKSRGREGGMGCSRFMPKAALGWVDGLQWAALGTALGFL